MGQTSTTDENKTPYDRVMEKAAAKKAAAKERAEDPNKEENKLVVERTPTGALTVSWKLRGAVPQALQGQFTSRFQLEKVLVGLGYEVNVLEYR